MFGATFHQASAEENLILRGPDRRNGAFINPFFIGRAIGLDPVHSGGHVKLEYNPRVLYSF
jgi:hypothetical protein